MGLVGLSNQPLQSDWDTTFACPELSDGAFGPDTDFKDALRKVKDEGRTRQ